MSVRAALHRALVSDRRVRVLAGHLAGELADLPDGARVLDVGCGDGRITRQVARERPGIALRGIEVWRRPQSPEAPAEVPIDRYEGGRLPYDDDAFDAVVLVDVFHHTGEPMALLREVDRVAGRRIVIKDHTLEGPLAGPILRAMDHFGNPSEGVAFPYTYWTLARWREAFAGLGLEVASFRQDLGLFPAPVSWILERSLHFLARLERPPGSRRPEAAADAATALWA